MKQILKNRVALGVLATTAIVLTISVLWLSVASPAQLARTSRGIFFAGGVLAVFTAGLVVGRLLSPCGAGRDSDGGGGPDDSEPLVPDPRLDPVEDELQRLIAEERSKLY